MTLCRWGAAALVLAATFAVAIAATAARADTRISLSDAVRQNKVDVEVKSLGGATGNTIRVEVQSRVAGELTIHIDPGTVFVSTTGNVQNMAGGQIKGEFVTARTYRPGSVMVLVDNRRRAYCVESFCLDYHKKPPRNGDPFSLDLSDARAQRILQAPKQQGASVWAYQTALWMDRSGVSPQEIQRRYPDRVTDVDVRAARGMLHEAQQTGVAEIPADTPADVRVQVERVFSPDPAVRKKAVAALSQMGDRSRAVLPLVAVNVVSDTPGRYTPETIVNVLADPARARQALAELGIPAAEAWLAPGAIPGLPEGIPGLGGGIPGLTTEPGEAMGALRNARLEAILGLLGSPLPGPRQRAARVLGTMKDPRAVEPLIGALGEANARVAELAAESLRQITGEDFGTDAAKWRAWLKEHRPAEPPADGTPPESSAPREF